MNDSPFTALPPTAYSTKAAGIIVGGLAALESEFGPVVVLRTDHLRRLLATAIAEIVSGCTASLLAASRQSLAVLRRCLRGELNPDAPDDLEAMAEAERVLTEAAYKAGERLKPEGTP